MPIPKLLLCEPPVVEVWTEQFEWLVTTIKCNRVLDPARFIELPSTKEEQVQWERRA